MNICLSLSFLCHLLSVMFLKKGYTHSVTYLTQCCLDFAETLFPAVQGLLQQHKSWATVAHFHFHTLQLLQMARGMLFKAAASRGSAGNLAVRVCHGWRGRGRRLSNISVCHLIPTVPPPPVFPQTNTSLLLISFEGGFWPPRVLVRGKQKIFLINTGKSPERHLHITFARIEAAASVMVEGRIGQLGTYS